jgi:hypothetical protein
VRPAVGAAWGRGWPDRFEDQVLGIASGHGGRVLQRARGSGTGGQPLEIQLLEFPSAQALDAFMTDGRRQSLADERDRVISRTEVIEVQLVHHTANHNRPVADLEEGQPVPPDCPRPGHGAPGGYLLGVCSHSNP